MDKMREEFEEWFASNYGTPPWPTQFDGSYYNDTTNNLLEVWKASRAALCVELPTKMSDEVLSLYDIGFNDGIDGAIESIEDTGVSHK